MTARTLVLLALLPAVAGAQLVRVPPVRTVATLGTCTDGSPKIVAVTDGATASDCATGAGTYDVTCYCANGTWSAAASGGSGTVTAVSVATANGVSGTVANATTTPAITVTLGAITPTSVAASGNVTGANLSGTNTGDQTTITGNAGTASALAADPADCSAGSAPVGINASGAAQSCTSYAIPGSITSSLITMSTARLLGRTTASTGAVEEITVSSPLTLSAGAVGLGTVGLANGGTGAALTDPGADRLAFWDDSASSVAWLTLGTGLSITGTTLDASGGGGVSDPLTIGTLITTTSLKPYGQTAGGCASTQVQIGDGATADSANCTYTSTATGDHANANSTGGTIGGTTYGARSVAESGGASYGVAASCTGGCLLAAGVNANGSGTGAIAIGGTAGQEGTAVGHSTNVSGVHAGAFGQLATSAYDASYALGCLATTTDANQLWIGGGSPCTITSIRLLTAVASPPVTCDSTHVNSIYGDTSPALCWCDGSAWVVLGGTSCS